ncbi:unnamed protein product [Boreogadus saida]
MLDPSPRPQDTANVSVKLGVTADQQKHRALLGCSWLPTPPASPPHQPPSHPPPPIPRACRPDGVVFLLEVAKQSPPHEKPRPVFEIRQCHWESSRSSEKIKKEKNKKQRVLSPRPRSNPSGDEAPVKQEWPPEGRGPYLHSRTALLSRSYEPPGYVYAKEGEPELLSC